MNINIRKHIESLGEINRSAEKVIIDVISAVTPWLAPFIPASMVYVNMTTILGFSPAIALIGAAAVEFLGLSSINTAVEFWRYNEDKHYRLSLRRITGRKKNRKFNGAPFLVAALSGLFYIAVVITVNAVLELNQESVDHRVFAKALLSLLSVDAGIIIALRASHSRRLQRSLKVSVPSTETLVESVQSIPDYETYLRFCEARNGDGAIPPGELTGKYKVPKSSAYKWYAQYNATHMVVKSNEERQA